MKLYRVAFLSRQEGSHGFHFCSSQAEAKRKAAAFKADAPDDQYAEIETIEFELTKHGVQKLLNRYADHPDNG